MRAMRDPTMRAKRDPTTENQAMFKGVDFFPHGTKWKIIEKRWIFVGLSWALATLSAVLLMTRGLNYGVD